MGKTSASSRSKRKKQKRAFRKITTLFFVMLLVLVVGCGVYLGAFLGRLEHVTTDRKEIDRLYATQENFNEEVIRSQRGITNILVVGLDSWADEESRSDVMMIVSIDTTHGELKMTSLARDIYLAIPEHGGNRLNAAWAYGKHTLLMATIELNFHLRIDHYVSLNFTAFGVLIEALGGYDMELSEGEFSVLEEALQEAGIDTSQGPGTYHLIKRSALDFVRLRKIDSDLMRNARQRRAILAMMTELRRCSMSKINRILWDVFPYIQTDMRNASILLHVIKAQTYLNWPVREQEIPVSGYWGDKIIDGMMILSIDWDANREILHQFIFESAPVEESEEAEEAEDIPEMSA